jgi:hypothetical protein
MDRRLRTACATSILLLLLTLPGLGQVQYGFFLHADDTSITITLYNGPGGPVAIPSMYDGFLVTAIGDDVFTNDTTVTSVTIPDTVTSIGVNSFSYCTGLTNVTIGNGVTNIEDGAFMESGLINLTIPSSVTSIGNGTFQVCLSLTSIYFQGNAPAINPDAFWGDSATVYYLPGTTGWGAMVNGMPTALLNVPAPTKMGVRTNEFGFTITGGSNYVFVVVEASTTLANPTWYPLATNTLASGPVYFSDPQWANYARRFYRLSWPQ